MLSSSSASFIIVYKNNVLICRKYPEWDVARNGPEAELVKTQRDLLQAEYELDAKLVVYPDKRQDMDNQWNEMKRKVKILQDSFVEFNKFVQENREKRERAKRKTKEEKIRQEKCKEEVLKY